MSPQNHKYKLSTLQKSMFFSQGLLLLVVLVFYPNGLEAAPPTVVTTTPANGADQVAPNLNQICVTFDQRMLDNSWSWAYADKAKFPEIAGKPYFDKDRKKNCLPVKLRPNTPYEIWINSASHQNFRSENNEPATPYLFKFRTRAK